VLEQRRGQLGDALLGTAHKSFRCYPTTLQFDADSERVGDSTRHLLARHPQVGFITTIGDRPRRSEYRWGRIGQISS
jgi:hypothetical protein